jgi:hypothetical protein
VPSAGINTGSALTPLKIGSTDTMSAAELAQIHFTGYTTGAKQILGTGEVLPVSTAHILDLGDVSQNLHVDAGDIMAMEVALTNLGAYQAAHPYLADVDDMEDVLDINGDGLINNADLQALVTDLSNSSGTTIGVPEPSTLVLGLLGFVSLSGLAFKRRRLAVVAA